MKRTAAALVSMLAACGGGGGAAPDTPAWGTAASDAQFVFMAPTGPDPVPGGAERPGRWELVAMNLDGSGRRQLTHNDEQEFLPHFSPDGTRLVYTRFVVGGYGVPGSQSRVTVYDFATGTTRDLTTGGREWYPVWSPDGARIAFLSLARGDVLGGGALWVMNADGSGAREVARPSGDKLDQGWGDLAWSSEDWILFVVARNNDSNTCLKPRLDKIRPDGSQRTQVTDGGPNCSVAGRESSGDADPGFSADGKTIYSSRGFPSEPPGIPGATVRRLYAVSSDAYHHPGKVERDLSLAVERDCIEGVPKGSPDGRRVLLFRLCGGGRPGVTLTDADGSYRQWIADGFGPGWNPVDRP